MKKKFLLIFLFLSCLCFVLSGCTNQSQTVIVDGISISKKNLYLAEGQSAQISAQVYPFNADNQNYELVSSDPSIVTIDNGFIQAIKAGNATISAISEDGGYKDTCNVLVTTVKNNLALNNYNNMNMPMNVANQKEEQATNQNNKKISKKTSKNTNFLSKNKQKTANSENFVKVAELENIDNSGPKTTAKQILNNIKNRTMRELSQGYETGKNLYNQLKQEFNVAINDIKNESENTKNFLINQTNTEINNTEKSFFDLQTEIFDSMQNIKNQIDQDIKNMKINFVNQIENIEQNLDGDDYVVETKDINGVKFVVISNKSNNSVENQQNG